ncbi:flavodoxin domain-containing protein [Oceanobacillus senegalensis]|uniref:flavodoxin domain-containing protein n=1 Tax=Oceanobacillus senegalensis TaxID=1936063 RepID=UPI000A30D4C1|nr:flavodoxin domain-containing protein [Oceanobacillus senegalensis]
MKVAIVYTSVTGNTEHLARILTEQFKIRQCDVSTYRIEDFPIQYIDKFDIFIIGTYTWGKGNIPENMTFLFASFEGSEPSHLVTGVFGTGDRFFPHFCGAVDRFRDLLKQKTRLAVTLKVELFPQKQDEHKCVKFVERCVQAHSSMV